jgi:sugar/nucleoside kinase (ribokinase family)
MAHADRRLDVLSVGDVVTDDFIRLIEHEAHVYNNEHGRWLAMQFGAKLPYELREVVPAAGNASNAAVAFSRLGLTGGLVTDVGGDEYGRQIIRALGKSNVDTRFVRTSPKKNSNYHFVLWYQEERTILIKHEEYEYDWPHLRASEVPRWVYFSSVSEHALGYHDDIAEWLDAHPSVRLAFQPGTFQIAAGADRLRRIYERAEILVVNREEAVRVGGGAYDDMHGLLNRLHALGPKTIVVTDGPKGAYASDGTKRLKMPAYPDVAPPYERTGAGDAFTATFVGALIQGHTLESALQLAPINSMSVCQKVGSQAGLLTERQLEYYLERAPEWYRPESF